MLKWHIDTHFSEMHTYCTLRTCPLTRKHFGSRSVLIFMLMLYVLRNKGTFKCDMGDCHVQMLEALTSY